MNPIDIELLKIEKKWQAELRANADKPMFICVGEKHEVELFDGLMRSKMSDDYDGKDFYLLHYQAFDNIQNYGAQLVEEWKDFYKVWQEQDEMVPDWDFDTQNNLKFQTDAYKAFWVLKNLYVTYPSLKDTNIFLYIAPKRVANKDHFSLWINEWCKLCENVTNIKLLYSEHHSNHVLPYNKYAHKFRIHVDINQLMQNTAAQTNRQNKSPDSDFQQQLILAGNHLSKSRFEEANIALGRAQKLAEQQKMLEGEAMALTMLAQSHLLEDKKDKAKEVHEKILTLVGKDKPISVQMYMNYGSFLIMQSQKSKAEKIFLEGADVAEKIGNHAMQIECLRIVGQINDGWLSSNSLKYYEKCWEVIQRMTDAEKAQGSIRYVASLLVKRYGKNSDSAKAIHEEMVLVFGQDWLVSTNFSKEMYS